MSIKHVKTIGYDKIINHVYLAIGLYKANDRSSRLDGKRSFGSKQELYSEDLHASLVQALCNGNDTTKEQLEQCWEYAEKCTTFALSQLVTTRLSKEKIYELYIEHTLIPILCHFITILSESEKDEFFFTSLDLFLKSDISNGLDHSARNILRDIINPDDIPYRYNVHLGVLRTLINDIRLGRIKGRNTIEEEVASILTYLNPNNSQKEALTPKENIAKRQVEERLERLRCSYHACMAILYFEKITKMGGKLSSMYKRIASSSYAMPRPTPSFMASASLTDIHKHMEQLMPFITTEDCSEFEEDEEDMKEGLDILLYWLGSPDHSTYCMPDKNKINEFIKKINLSQRASHFKPYAFLAKVCILIKNSRIEDALQLLDSNEALCLNQTLGFLVERAATLFIGCSIHINAKKIKHNTFEPIIQIILDSQLLYEILNAHDTQKSLNLKYHSIIATPYSHTTLRSIMEYNEIIVRIHGDIGSSPQYNILNAWVGFEALLVKIESTLLEMGSDSSVKHVIDKALTKQDREKSLINYLPNSTFYNCIRELKELDNYLHIPAERSPRTHSLLHQNPNNIKKILQAINPIQFKKEQECYKNS